MERLKGKKALITGANSGIGKATAIRFAQEGANIAINYVANPDQAEEVRLLCTEARKGLPGKEIIVQADVSNEDHVRAMFRTVISELGGLDILVNNAGIQKAAASHEVTLADFERVIGVNLRGPFLCSREALLYFLDQGGGVILNNSSVHQVIPKPKYLPYSVSKGGLGNLTRTLALEYAGRNIRVNAVAPGAIVTPINNAWINDPKATAAVDSHIPQGRAGSAEEIAGVLAFLASDEAAYITGQTIFVDGGLTLYPDFRSPWSSGE